MTERSVIKNIMAPKRVDKSAKRTDITTAAALVFAEKGFQGASVSDIAEAAGVSKGSLYSYFNNKEDLFYATFQAYQAELLQQCQEAITAAPSASAKIHALLTLTMASLRDNIALFPLTLELWAAASSGAARERFAEVMESVYQEFRQLMTALIEAGKADGEFTQDVDANAMAAWLVGGLDGLMLQFWFDQSLPIEQMAEQFMQTLLTGMGQRPTGAST